MASGATIESSSCATPSRARHPSRDSKASFAGFNGAGSLAAIRLDQDVSESGGKTELLVLDLAAAKVEQLPFSRVLDCAPQAGELRAVIAEADGRKLSVVALASKQVLKEIELPAPAKMVRLAPQGGFYAVEEAGTASAYSEAPGEPCALPTPAGARPLAIGAYSGFLALDYYSSGYKPEEHEPGNGLIPSTSTGCGIIP